MPIMFTCPHCGVSKPVGDQYAGQTGPCAACGQVVTVPDGAVSNAASASKGGDSQLMALAVCVVVGVAVLGLFIVLLLPEMQIRNPSRMQCSNNLRQLSIAMHLYRETYGSFPAPFIPDKDGKPMHSWRVALLPYLEHDALYNQYNSSQPWDSPGNMALANQMPAVFRCVSSTDGLNTSNYMLVVGPGASSEAGKWLKISDFKDGLSNTILLVEVKGATTNWLEPADLELDAVIAAGVNGAFDGTTPGSDHPGGANVAMADGAVHFLGNAIDPTTFEAVFTRAGEEPVIIDFSAYLLMR